MTTEVKTNQHGVRYYIEGAADFCDNGRFTTGKGWFVGLVVGNDFRSGHWYETRAEALADIEAYTGAAA